MRELIPVHGFVVPQNPVVAAGANVYNNPVVREMAMGCGSPRCTGGLNGMGEWEVPYVGVTVPGSSWMYLLGAGALVGGYLMMSRKR